jgi:hypothetical protein
VTLRAGLDERAQQRAVADDARVVGGVRGGRHLVGEVVERGGTADLVEPCVAGEPLGDGDGVDGLARGRERLDGLEDDAVRVAVEVVGLEQLERDGDRVARDQAGAEDRDLRLERVGRHAVGPRDADDG